MWFLTTLYDYTVIFVHTLILNKIIIKYLNMVINEIIIIYVTHTTTYSSPIEN